MFFHICPVYLQRKELSFSEPKKKEKYVQSTLRTNVNVDYHNNNHDNNNDYNNFNFHSIYAFIHFPNSYF